MTARRGKVTGPNGTTKATVRRGLRPLRGAWQRTALQLLEAGASALVRVLIAEVRGSSPREVGTSMLVTDAEIYGTIGGGNLEWQALRAARTLLVGRPAPSPTRAGGHGLSPAQLGGHPRSGGQPSAVQVHRLVLGRELGQCCGGVVQLWIERLTREDLPLLRRLARPTGTSAYAQSLEPVAAVQTVASNHGVVRRLIPRGPTDTPFGLSSTDDGQVTLIEPLARRYPTLWLYGAGHVGHALIHLLADLPFDVTWIDSRHGMVPDTLPDNVRAVCPPAPITTIDSAPRDALFLVMTHDHALDYDLCRRILERGDFAWLGLIGSKSKAARFRSRLARDAFRPEQIARLTCPIGIDGISSKLPAAIAVAVAAQLLLRVRAATAADGPATAIGPAAPVGPAASVGPAAPVGPNFSAVTPFSSGAHEDCSPDDCQTCAGRARGSPRRRWDPQ